MNLKEALEKTRKAYDDCWDTVSSLSLGSGCALCELAKHDCSKCVVQNLCNALEGESHYKNKRTLFGKIAYAYSDFLNLMMEAVTELDKLVKAQG